MNFDRAFALLALCFSVAVLLFQLWPEIAESLKPSCKNLPNGALSCPGVRHLVKECSDGSFIHHTDDCQNWGVEEIPAPAWLQEHADEYGGQAEMLSDGSYSIRAKGRTVPLCADGQEAVVTSTYHSGTDIGGERVIATYECPSPSPERYFCEHWADVPNGDGTVTRICPTVF